MVGAAFDSGLTRTPRREAVVRGARRDRGGPRGRLLLASLGAHLGAVLAAVLLRTTPVPNTEPPSLHVTFTATTAGTQAADAPAPEAPSVQTEAAPGLTVPEPTSEPEQHAAGAPAMAPPLEAERIAPTPPEPLLSMPPQPAPTELASVQPAPPEPPQPPPAWSQVSPEPVFPARASPAPSPLPRPLLSMPPQPAPAELASVQPAPPEPPQPPPAPSQVSAPQPFPARASLAPAAPPRAAALRLPVPPRARSDTSANALAGAASSPQAAGAEAGGAAGMRTQTPAAIVAPVSSASPGPLLISNPRFRVTPAPPAYPPLAREQGQEGEALVRVRLDREGNAEEVLLAASSGHPMLDRAALAAVRRWAFEPGRRGSEAVIAWVQIPVRFALR